MTTDMPNTANTPEQEEIEVQVRQIEEPQATSPEIAQMNEAIRRTMLAGIGMFAVSMEELDKFMKRMAERGEVAQKDADKVINQMMEQLRASQPAGTTPPLDTEGVQANAEAAAANARNAFESNLEQFLNRMNIPSQRDIDELSARVAQLTARVEELRRTIGEKDPA